MCLFLVNMTSKSVYCDFLLFTLLQRFVVGCHNANNTRKHRIFMYQIPINSFNLSLKFFLLSGYYIKSEKQNALVEVGTVKEGSQLVSITPTKI